MGSSPAPTLRRVSTTRLWLRLVVLLLSAGLIIAGLRWLAWCYGYQPNDANLPVTLALTVLLALAVWRIWRRTRPRTTYSLDELVKDGGRPPGCTDLPKDEP